jgi:hypothetical protein
MQPVTIKVIAVNMLSARRLFLLVKVYICLFSAQFCASLVV